MNHVRSVLAGLSASILAISTASAGSFSFSHSDDAGFSWAYIEPGHGGHVSVMNGSGSEALENLQSESTEPLLWFKRDGREYVVRDDRFVDRARVATKPMRDLGREQGRIGKLQGQLGARQGRIGARMGALGARLGGLATREAIAGLRGEEADDVSDKRESIERKMHQLEREMRPLARQQEELGAKQAELGKRQQAASRDAESELKTILDEAIRAGAAEKVSSRWRMPS